MGHLEIGHRSSSRRNAIRIEFSITAQFDKVPQTMLTFF
jgi:hypothetical protein